MNFNKNILTKVATCAFALVLVFAAAQYVFAVSGFSIRSDDDKKIKKSKFSDLKGSVSFSLKDTYSLTQTNAKKHFSPSVEGKSKTTTPQSIISYKKGNTVYLMPYQQSKGVKLPNFISATPGVSVK